MGSTLITWARDHRSAWLIGAGLWLVVAVVAGASAASRGTPVWPAIVTLDEWVVAMGLLVWVVRPFIPAPETVGIADRPRVVRAVWWLREFTWALGLVFVLDLLARAVLGLGLKAF